MKNKAHEGIKQLPDQQYGCHDEELGKDRDIKEEELNRKAERLEKGRTKAANRTYGKSRRKGLRKAREKLTKPYRKRTFPSLPENISKTTSEKCPTSTTHH